MIKLILEKLRVIGLSFLFLLLASPDAFIPVKWWKGSQNEQLLAYLIFMITILVTYLFTAKKLKRYDLMPFSQSGFSWKYLGCVFLAYIVIFGIDNLGMIWLEVIGEQTTVNEAELEVYFKELPDLVVILLVVIVGPIMEEVIFRGFLNKILFKHWRLVGIIFSSLLFGAAHVPTNLPSWLIYAGGAFVFAYLYEKTDDLAYPIILHILNNAIASLNYF